MRAAESAERVRPAPEAAVAAVGAVTKLAPASGANTRSESSRIFSAGARRRRREEGRGREESSSRENYEWRRRISHVQASALELLYPEVARNARPGLPARCVRAHTKRQKRTVIDTHQSYRGLLRTCKTFDSVGRCAPSPTLASPQFALRMPPTSPRVPGGVPDIPGPGTYNHVSDQYGSGYLGDAPSFSMGARQGCPTTRRRLARTRVLADDADAERGWEDRRRAAILVWVVQALHRGRHRRPRPRQVRAEHGTRRAAACSETRPSMASGRRRSASRRTTATSRRSTRTSRTTALVPPARWPTSSRRASARFRRVRASPTRRATQCARASSGTTR